MCIYPTGGHGFGFRSTWAYHDQMLSDLTRWLDSFKAPRKDAIRVACIGNSITDGYGIDMATQKGYPAILQNKLGDGYEVKNYGLNDSKTHNWVHKAEFGKDLQTMVDSLKALPSKPKIYLCSPIPAFKPSWTINDSVIVNGEIPVIKKVAKKNKCGFIDLHSKYTFADLMLDDGIHPNGKGAVKMAEIIYEAISEKK